MKLARLKIQTIAAACVTLMPTLMPLNSNAQQPTKIVQARPAPPVPASPILSADKVTSQMIMIEATILESDKDMDVKLEFPAGIVVKASETNEPFLIITEKSRDKIIKTLVDSKAAKVISRPKLMTVSRQNATVQIGKQVAIAPAADGDGMASHHIGLQLDCRPTLKGDRILLEIGCEHSKLGEKNRVESKTIETAVDLKDGETLFLSGARSNGLILFLTAKVVSKNHPAILPNPVGVAKLSSKTLPAPLPKTSSKESSMGAHVAHIQDVFHLVDPNSLSSIDVDEREILVRAYVSKTAQRKIPEVVSKLGASASLRVVRVSSKAIGDGTELEIECDLIGDKKENKPSSNENLAAVLAKLFPGESIDVVELPHSVVLRGTASEAIITRVVNIAEAYYPSVINHIDVVDLANEDAVEVGSVENQLDDLRGEIRSLRQDVKQLIKLLKAEPHPNASAGQPIQSDAASQPSAKRSVWTMDWKQAESILKQNHPGVDEVDLAQRIEKTRKSYDRLRLLQFWQNATNQQRSKQNQMLNSIFTNNTPQITIGARRNQAESSVFRLRVLAEEVKLREQLGIAESDGRMITPLPAPESDQRIGDRS